MCVCICNTVYVVKKSISNSHLFMFLNDMQTYTYHTCIHLVVKWRNDSLNLEAGGERHEFCCMPFCNVCVSVCKTHSQEAL